MKQIKCVLIIIGILVLVILIDTIQARIFEISPLISKKVKLEGGSSVNKGFIIDTFFCVEDKDIVTVSWHFKKSKFTCPVYEVQSTVEEKLKVKNIKIRVNDEVLDVKLEDNAATQVLIERLKQEDITINASEYGNFEKVGYLGFALPTNDIQTATKPGDVMLYQGNQITIFYESNSWSYTKIGEITNKTQDELKSILGYGGVTLVLSIN
ncbi:MAG: hypothetical protein J1F35_01380 [Erysipelotrichales bacterium]|nr:hypothetical protein [Erysipelotrichales bacterium]